MLAQTHQQILMPRHQDLQLTAQLPWHRWVCLHKE
jgi:hypothetical protein